MLNTACPEIFQGFCRDPTPLFITVPETLSLFRKTNTVPPLKITPGLQYMSKSVGFVPVSPVLMAISVNGVEQIGIVAL